MVRKVYKGVVVGATYYGVIDDDPDGNDIRVYTYSAGAIWADRDTQSDYSFPDDDQAGIAYDGDDTLYFIANKDGDSKDYLLSFDITSNEITVREEFNVALMLDRFCAGTSNSPWEFEKGFHMTSPYIFQIPSRAQLQMSFYLHKLQDLGLTGGATIKAITDKYLIDSNKNVYEYQDNIDDLIKAMATYQIYSYPKGSFAHSEALSSDQLIEIFQNNSGTYTLVFRGKAGVAKYAIRKNQTIYTFSPKNLGWDDLEQKISYSASATGGDECVLALLGQLSTPYLYADATSVPNITTTITYEFDDVKLKDALYICCVLLNGYWWFEPNGYFHFSTWAARPNSQWYRGSAGLNYEAVGTEGTDIDWVDSATLLNSCTCTIEAELDNHKNILKLTHDGDADDPSIYHTITATATGTFEWWWASSDITNDQRVQLLSNTTVGPSIRLRNSKYYYNDLVGADVEIIGAVPTNNIFDHFKLIWDCTTDTFDLYINGVLRVNGGEFRFVLTSVNKIYCSPTTNAAFSQYIDAPGLVGEADSRGYSYLEGDNLLEILRQDTKDIGPPTAEITNIIYNTWDIRGGWNSAANAPFSKLQTDDDHIRQYGPLLWTGKDTFVGARTQAALNSIASGLEAWQGMQDNPVNARLKVMTKYYYPVGYCVSFQYSGRTEFATETDTLKSKNKTDFKRPGLVELILTTNIVKK